jgi:hypothetical protein
MIASNKAPRARWRVAWVAKGRVIDKSFGTDFMDALALYEKAIKAEKRGATLICANQCFEPPVRLQPKTVRKVKKSVVKRRGKKYIKRDIIEGRITPIKKLNLQGIWWCGYCSKLRKFKRQDGFYYEKVWVPEPGYHCPICGISHRDGGIRKFNATAARIYAVTGRLPDIYGKPKKRKRR